MSKSAYLILVVICFISCTPEINTINNMKKEVKARNSLHFFADHHFYSPSDTLKVFSHSEKNGIISLYNKIDTSLVMQTEFKAFKQVQFNRDFIDGCNWEETSKLILPSNLSNGIYFLSAVSGNDSTTFPIVINQRSNSEILVLASTNTWQAYNFWGGGSFYKLDSAYSDFGKVSSLINFRRPNPYANGGSHLAAGEMHLIRWLTDREIAFNILSDDKFESENLNQYSTLVLNCHNEYWTDSMLAQLESFIRRGGNVLSLGGNQIYARVTRNGTQLEFHEHGEPHIHDGSKGGRWRDLGKSESQYLGVQFERDLYGTYDAYRVTSPEHWVFKGSSCSASTIFGQVSSNKGKACGHEMDCSNHYSPSTTKVIAKGLNGLRFQDGEWINQPGAGEMVIGEYSEGGIFFSVGSITFTGCLYQDEIANQILINVFEKCMTSDE